MNKPTPPFRVMPGTRFRWILEATGAALLACSAVLGWAGSHSAASANNNGDPLWLVVDVSRSMLAGSPSRLDLARVGLEAWLDRIGPVLPRPTGLIVFAAHARTVLAPGNDYLLLRSQVSRMTTLAQGMELAPGPGDLSGTDLASGIALAHSWPGRCVIWLLTDGDDPVRRTAPANSPKAARAWVIGAPGVEETIPEEDPPATSSPRPERVRELTFGEVMESGQSPPSLPELSRAALPVDQSAGPMALALAGLAVLFASAMPARWIPAAVMAISGCSGYPAGDRAQAGLVLLARTRLLPAQEQGRALRATETTIRKALAASDDPALLEALVICLLDQAPYDPRAPRLAAEIAIRLPNDRGEPLRARARWLEALQSTTERQTGGDVSQGDSWGDDSGDAEGTPGTSRRREPRPSATGESETREALPGAGRLPIVADTTQPQSLTRQEAARLINAAANRLTPPAPPRRSAPAQGVPDW